MLEERIVRFCAPTIMGNKTGSLFNACHEDPKTLCRDVVEARKSLSRFGIDIRLFFKEDKPPLVYVYRVKALERDLADPDCQDFLRQHGYEKFDPKSALSQLSVRLRHYTEFPHEIGLFLSYPLSDVKNFVQFGSTCSKMRGYWCVYDNEEQAKKCFADYDRCRQECLLRYQQGQRLEDFARAM